MVGKNIGNRYAILLGCTGRMSWQKGHQKRRTVSLRSNEDLLALEGFLDEREAKLALYEFLRNNVTFATDLLLGVKLSLSAYGDQVNV